MAYANAAESLPGTYTAASPPEARFSRRSKATMAFPSAMYSIILIIVECGIRGRRIGRDTEIRGRQVASEQLIVRDLAGEPHPPIDLELTRQALQLIELIAVANDRSNVAAVRCAMPSALTSTCCVLCVSPRHFRFERVNRSFAHERFCERFHPKRRSCGRLRTLWYASNSSGTECSHVRPDSTR